MRILYATDGSEAALAGARLLARLPLDADCQLRLLTVLPGADGNPVKSVLAPAHNILRNTRASIGMLTRHGFADEEILRAAAPYASLPPTDLIVVGSRGLSTFERLFVGSVAEHVARFAECSVLVARPLVNDLRRVVLGVDGSEGATRAAEWLKRFPLPHDCEIDIVGITPHREPRLLMGKYGWPADLPVPCEPATDTTRQCLDALLASFVGEGKSVSAEILPGQPAESLIRYAEKHRSDLIVVGSRGLSGIQRLLLGSVSEAVLRHAPCSVLVVRSHRYGHEPVPCSRTPMELGLAGGSCEAHPGRDMACAAKETANC